MLECLKHNSSLLKQSIEEAQERLKSMASDFLDTMENREQIHKILQERDLQGRPLYFLLKKHPVLLFKIETIIELEWEGAIPLYRRESLFLCSMARIFWEEGRTSFGARGWCRRCKTEVSPFSFRMARRSALLKYLTAFLIILAIGLSMQIFVVLTI